MHRKINNSLPLIDLCCRGNSFFYVFNYFIDHLDLYVSLDILLIIYIFFVFIAALVGTILRVALSHEIEQLWKVIDCSSIRTRHHAINELSRRLIHF